MGGLNTLKYTWKDLVYIQGQGVFSEEHSISGEHDDFSYEIDDFIEASALLHRCPEEDIRLWSMDGDNFALDNGDYVTVAQNLCSSIGKVTYGDSATVYYSGGYPSAENIYHVDIYGRVYDGDDDDNPDDPDNPDGPWIDPVLPPDPDNPDPWVGPVLPPENGGFNPNVNQTLGGFKQ